LAQCRDLKRFEEINKKTKVVEDSIDSFLLERTVLTFEGDLTTETQYLERGAVTAVPQPSRKILDSILRGEMNWLELTDQQKDEIAKLKTVEVGTNGIQRIYYYGAFQFKSLGPYPEKTWDNFKYQDWASRFQKASMSADRSLGEKISETLLAHQLESMRTALAISKFIDLGPYHIVENFLPVLKLKEKQLEKIKDFRERRLKRLQEIFRSIDKQSFRQLSETQTAFLRENLGDRAEIYPCIWLFVN
jgi:hypothetical protein